MPQLGRRWLWIVAFTLAFLPIDSAKADTPLTNADVITLCKAGLSDDLVIAKIKQAVEVSFQLEPADLVNLRDQGVSERIVTAMLERTTPAPKPAPPPNRYIPPGMPGSSLQGVSLVSQDIVKDLTLRMGSVSVTGFGPVQLRWLNITGLRAAVRSPDRGSALLVRLDIDPTESNEFVLVRLEVDDDDKLRSLKLGQPRAFRSGVGNFFRADSEYMIGFTVKSEGQGLWRIQPNSQLQPGEYGLFTGMVGIYDFGID